MYSRIVRVLLCCLPIVGVSLFGQSPNGAAAKMDSIFAAMTAPKAARAVLNEQLTDVILAAAQRDHSPSRGSVAAFAEALSGVLNGREFRPQSELSHSVLEILNPAGANFTKAGRLEVHLKTLGVDHARIQMVMDRYIKIGEQVRGPDDGPVLPLKLR
jgi:hypothetical protein